MGGEEVEHRGKERRPMKAVGTVILGAKRRERNVATSEGL